MLSLRHFIGKTSCSPGLHLSYSRKIILSRVMCVLLCFPLVPAPVVTKASECSTIAFGVPWWRSNGSCGTSTPKRTAIGSSKANQSQGIEHHNPGAHRTTALLPSSYWTIGLLATLSWCILCLAHCHNLSSFYDTISKFIHSIQHSTFSGDVTLLSAIAVMDSLSILCLLSV